MEAKAYRLPGNVRPTSYDIHLDARPGKETFEGRVRISLRVLEPTDAIELHATGLRFRDAVLRFGGRRLEGRAQVDEEGERVAFGFSEKAPAGDAVLEVGYTGKVSRNMEGLYLSRNGPEECLATQFQETDARAVFPCFDEPDYKASLRWRVTTDPDLTVLANGPVESVEDAEDGKSRTWTFGATRPISTYVGALAIGDFASTPTLEREGVPLRVWSIRGKERLGAFANDLTGRLLPWFEDYFAVPYPYGKYDQLAVPSFSAGAMENVGLVLFRENLLLMDPRTASWRQEKALATVVAHEFAHMWFGNLVTMAWWDDIWLNEAFAEWMAHKAVDALHPEYHTWDDFQAAKAVALVSDALESTHSIYSPVQTPQQATELFDAITYNKGSAVMRMLESFLGAEAFRAGLRTYMREFAESNAEGADLWRHLEAASERPVGRIMRAWITQPGYPVVRAELRREDGAHRLRVRQDRFLSRPGAEAPEAVWPVPLVIRYRDASGVHATRFLLEEREATVTLSPAGDLEWLHANADGIGFYRLDPGDDLLEGALRHLTELSAAEQVGLLDDQWALVQSGRSDVRRFLRTLDAVAARARHHAVVDRVAHHVHDLEERLVQAGDEAGLEGFRAWVREALGPGLTEVGLEPRPGEAREEAQRRAILLEALAAVGLEPRAREHALALAGREAEDAASVPPELAGPAVQVAARFGDEERFRRHVDLYVARRNARAPPQETQRYLWSFAAFREPELVGKALGLMDEKVVPLEAVGPLLRAMLGTPHAREHAWEHMKRHWGELRATLGDMWTGFLVEATGNLPPRRRDEMVRFYDEHLKGVAQQAYARALERLDQRAELQERVVDDLAAWFRARGPA